MNHSKYIKITLVFTIGLGLLSCEPEFVNEVRDGVQYTSGDADFTTFVALGNSLTAGFADGALYIDGQQNSLPNIMADQFSLVDGGVFDQPLMADNLGGLKVGGTQVSDNRLVLRLNPDGTPQGPVILEGDPTTEATNILTGPFNNMGVPGAKSFHLVADGYGTLNPYFGRFASSATASVLDDALAQDPTFFMLWIGNNDALGYATSGGDLALDELTPETTFKAAYDAVAGALAQATEGKGVVANLPDVTSIPYFTTVPFAPLSPLDPNFGPQIPTLNATFAELNGAFAFLGVPERSIQFSETGASAVVIKDESLPDISTALTQTLQVGGLDATTAAVFGMLYGQTRQATADDLMVLPSSRVIGQANTDTIQQLISLGLPQATAEQLSINGVTFPLEDKWVLLPSEQEEVASAHAFYNQVIADAANGLDLAFVDARALLSQVANGGIAIDEGVVTSTFASGGAFSLDGVHPTARGYALTANAFIDAINQKYDATIPKVNPGTFTTIFVE
ncbi:G-D-S-L family lipolytic protein [Sungkyunkwania multivorans]|uniref:G-D-S-L family lipolytic protein n=1 Tax=Sungkyunkwania multivorans TaxID=1173618 RepID=A0ABW3D485_9FLAO